MMLAAYRQSGWEMFYHVVWSLKWIVLAVIVIKGLSSGVLRWFRTRRRL
jgi:hypothetical protein